MIRFRLAPLILAIAFWCSPLFAQDSPAQRPGDLKMELRSATGSNRFQLGEVIPLEVLISSSTPNRYLEPCKMFWESCFGYPQCRFVTNWSFDVAPGTGWTDIGWHGCMAMSGPTMDVKSSDLTMEPKKYSYMLTNRFRFDTPGNYTVQLSIDGGSGRRNQRDQAFSEFPVKPNSVSKTAEIILEIVPAADGVEEDISSSKVSPRGPRTSRLPPRLHRRNI